jgi:hypothetical protein
MLPPKHAQGGDPSPWLSRRATPGRSFLNALAEVREVGTAHGTARGLVYLLDRPLAPVWAPVGVQTVLELLRDMHGIYDTKRHTV